MLVHLKRAATDYAAAVAALRDADRAYAADRTYPLFLAVERCMLLADAAAVALTLAALEYAAIAGEDAPTGSHTG